MSEIAAEFIEEGLVRLLPRRRARHDAIPGRPKPCSHRRCLSLALEFVAQRLRRRLGLVGCRFCYDCRSHSSRPVTEGRRGQRSPNRLRYNIY